MYYQELSQESIDEAARIIADHFVPCEPMYSCFDLDQKTYFEFAQGYLRRAINEGLSFIARDKTSHAAAGVIVAGDLKEDIFEFITIFDEVFQKSLAPDFAFLQQLEHSYLNQHPFLPGECLHIHQVAVLPVFQGRGVATSLIDKTLETAKQKGFKVAISDATGPASIKAHKKAGFTPADSLAYSDFLFEGKPVYNTLPGACVLMEKVLLPEH